MTPCIEKISLFLYLRTILFGKNRKIRSLSISEKGTNAIEENTEVDMIASLGKKALIITVPNPHKPDNRMPLIVKRWSKDNSNISNENGVAIYHDHDGFRWIYSDNWAGRSLAFFDDVKHYHFSMD